MHEKNIFVLKIKRKNARFIRFCFFDVNVASICWQIDIICEIDRLNFLSLFLINFWTLFVIAICEKSITIVNICVRFKSFCCFFLFLYRFFSSVFLWEKAIQQSSVSCASLRQTVHPIVDSNHGKAFREGVQCNSLPSRETLFGYRRNEAGSRFGLTKRRESHTLIGGRTHLLSLVEIVA